MTGLHNWVCVWGGTGVCAQGIMVVLALCVSGRILLPAERTTSFSKCLCDVQRDDIADCNDRIVLMNVCDSLLREP